MVFSERNDHIMAKEQTDNFLLHINIIITVVCSYDAYSLNTYCILYHNSMRVRRNNIIMIEFYNNWHKVNLNCASEKKNE